MLAVRNRDSVSFVLLAFPLTYYLVMGASRHYFARYALPLVPFAALFAAEAIVALLPRVGTRHVGLASRPSSAILVVAAVAQSLAQDVAHDVLLTRHDTRTLAKNWIEANIPASDKDRGGLADAWAASVDTGEVDARLEQSLRGD